MRYDRTAEKINRNCYAAVGVEAGRFPPLRRSVRRISERSFHFLGVSR